IHFHRHRGIGRRTATLLEHQREIVLGAGIPLPSRQAVPTLRRGLVLGHAAAELVGESEIVLRLRNVAIRRLAEPERRLEVVLFHANPVGVYVAYVKLLRRESLLL